MKTCITKLEYLSMIDNGLVHLPENKHELKKMLSSFCSMPGDAEHNKMISDLLLDAERNAISIIDKIINSHLSSGEFVYISVIRYQVKRSKRVKKVIADRVGAMTDSLLKMEADGKIEFSDDRMKVRLIGSDKITN